MKHADLLQRLEAIDAALPPDDEDWAVIPARSKLRALIRDLEAVEVLAELDETALRDPDGTIWVPPLGDQNQSIIIGYEPTQTATTLPVHVQVTRA